MSSGGDGSEFVGSIQDFVKAMQAVQSDAQVHAANAELTRDEAAAYDGYAIAIIGYLARRSTFYGAAVADLAQDTAHFARLMLDHRRRDLGLDILTAGKKEQT